MILQNIRGSNTVDNFFRRKIKFSRRPEKAVARIFSDTGFELFINGRFVLSLHEWSNNRDYDLSLFFHEGENLIAVHADNIAGHRGFAFELCADGKSVLVSDRTWKTLPEERWGWILPDYDDSRWQEASELDLSAAGWPQWSTLPGSDPAKIFPCADNSLFFTGNVPKGIDSPFYTAKKPVCTPSADTLKTAGDDYRKHVLAEDPAVILPKNVTAMDSSDGTIRQEGEKFLLSAPKRYTGPSVVVDLGGNRVGFLRMRLQCSSMVSFRLHHAETLSEVFHEPSREQPLHRMVCEEYRVSCGTQEFEARMRFGGRYLRIEFFDTENEIIADGFALRQSLYPVAHRGYFHSDDEELNTLWKMGERTLHNCMQEFYIDAPKRDRLHWVGDTCMQALLNYYTFADRKLFEFCWDKMAETQYPDGSVPSSYGQGLSLIWDYVAWYVIAFRDYVFHTGDSAFLLKHKRSIERAVNYLSSKAGADGLIDVPANPLGKWWMVVLNNAVGKDTFMNQLYLEALETAVLLEQLAGDPKEEADFAARIALTAPAVKKLAEEHPLEECRNNWTSSVMFHRIVEHTAETQGAGSALALLRKGLVPFLRCGSDTFGEGIGEPGPVEQDTGKHIGGSYCHGWTALPLYFIPVHIAGITPAAPGWKKVRVKPSPCNLRTFTSVVPVPQGEIALRFENGRYTLSLPEGCTAEFSANGKTVQAQPGITEL